MYVVLSTFHFRRFATRLLSFLLFIHTAKNCATLITAVLPKFSGRGQLQNKFRRHDIVHIHFTRRVREREREAMTSYVGSGRWRGNWRWRPTIQLDRFVANDRSRRVWLCKSGDVRTRAQGQRIKCSFARRTSGMFRITTMILRLTLWPFSKDPRIIVPLFLTIQSFLAT